jgi:hypothetical protein
MTIQARTPDTTSDGRARAMRQAAAVLAGGGFTPADLSDTPLMRELACALGALLAQQPDVGVTPLRPRGGA